jgi:hypothetical protein
LALADAILVVLGITPQEDGRALGLYGDPQQTGLLLLAGFCFAPLLPRPFRFPAMLLTLGGIGLTKTRSTWIGALGAIAARLLPRLRRGIPRLAALASVTLIVGWFLIPLATTRFELNPASIDLRTRSWDTGFDLIGQSPLVGHGWALGGSGGVVGDNGPPPYNLWINVAASTGLIGAATLTTFFVLLLRVLIRGTSREAALAVPYVVGFLLQSMGEMTFFAASPATIAFFAISGAAIGSLSSRPADHARLADHTRSLPSMRGQ